MGSISNAQIMLDLTAITFSCLAGVCLGSALYLKIKSVSEYALGKFIGNEYGKDLNDKIFVYVPYHRSLWKSLIVRSISSLISYKIASIAVSRLFASVKIPFLSRFLDLDVGFIIGCSISPLTCHGIGYNQRKGVYLSPEECQNRNIDPTQVRTIRTGVNIYEKKSLWSLLGTPTLVPGSLDP